jgi:hypothetical protein
VVARLFSWTPTNVDPWSALRWANGRLALPDRAAGAGLGLVMRTVERVGWDGEEIRIGQRSEDLVHRPRVHAGGESVRMALICQKHGHTVYRLTCGRQSYALKWFEGRAPPVEVSAYALLAQLGVPTLPVHGRAPNALLLEDLDTSIEWRPAIEADVERAETGVAVAEWYRNLHAAGRKVLAAPHDVPRFLILPL